MDQTSLPRVVAFIFGAIVGGLAGALFSYVFDRKRYHCEERRR